MKSLLLCVPGARANAASSSSAVAASTTSLKWRPTTAVGSHPMMSPSSLLMKT